MTRRFLDDIRTDISALAARAITDYPDNVIGSITPAILRNYTIDFVNLQTDQIDSTIQDEATLGITIPKLTQPVTTSFTPLVTVYDVEDGDDSAGAGFLNVNLAGGSIALSAASGWTYSLTGFIAIIGAQNTRYDIAILVNGLEQGFIGSTTGEGIGDPTTMSAKHTIDSSTSNAVIQIGIRTDSASDITISSGLLEVVIVPTNSP